MTSIFSRAQALRFSPLGRALLILGILIGAGCTEKTLRSDD